MVSSGEVGKKSKALVSPPISPLSHLPHLHLFFLPSSAQLQRKSSSFLFFFFGFFRATASFFSFFFLLLLLLSSARQARFFFFFFLLHSNITLFFSLFLCCCFFFFFFFFLSFFFSSSLAHWFVYRFSFFFFGYFMFSQEENGGNVENFEWSGYSSNICFYVLIWIRVLISNFLGLCLNLCYCVADIVLMFKWVCVLELIFFLCFWAYAFVFLEWI